MVTTSLQHAEFSLQENWSLAYSHPKMPSAAQIFNSSLQGYKDHAAAFKMSCFLLITGNLLLLISNMVLEFLANIQTLAIAKRAIISPFSSFLFLHLSRLFPSISIYYFLSLFSFLNAFLITIFFFLTFFFYFFFLFLFLLRFTETGFRCISSFHIRIMNSKWLMHQKDMTRPNFNCYSEDL